MYDVLLNKLTKRKTPIDITMAGLGFMGFGFLSALSKVPNMRVPLIISRRPADSVKFLKQQGFKAQISSQISKIYDYAASGGISVTDELEVLYRMETDATIEMTGTVDYGTQVALTALEANQHLATMNPELQATVGYKLRHIADKKKLIITDVIGDQPGSLSRLIHQAKIMGFNLRLAGNMKRFMNLHATQEEMKPWADDKGLSVRQTVSFTDGTKQAIEMNLVANYFDLGIIQFGMKGVSVSQIHEALDLYNWAKIPAQGVVDYAIGKTLFPGVFIIAEHLDPKQQKYLRYLNMGDGPLYLLFDSYHLCHLEVPLTLAKMVLYGQESINNRVKNTETIALAKFDLPKIVSTNARIAK